MPKPSNRLARNGCRLSYSRKTWYLGRVGFFFYSECARTQNVIAACKIEKKVSKLVFTSSPSVVFDNRPQEGCDESVPYPAKYENFYSHTKALAEQMVRSANYEDLLTVSLRPHLIWGPRDVHLLPRLIDRARSGKLAQVGDGTNLLTLPTWKMLPERICLQQMFAAWLTCCWFSLFHYPGRAVNLWNWIHNFLSRLDIAPIKHRISLPVAAQLCSVGWTHRTFHLTGEPKMTRFLASELAMSHYYDISRAKRDLGYQPQFSMGAALEKTLASLR
jgi:nucleoside-diphosphate-sugar epimerase